MKHLQNLHTHSRFCDGQDTPEEMLLTAMEKGFESIGFSGHSWMHFSPAYAMSPEDTQAYRREILRLREKYAGKIGVFLGLEMEMFSTDVDLSGYDYLIGSSHYFCFDGKMVGFDRAAGPVRQVIDEWFGGDGMKYAKAYYKNLARLPEYGDFDVIGHFDLIAKHCEKEDFFDTASEEYRGYAAEAAEALAGKIPYFEVNTGAIARGYRTTPYPDAFLLRKMKELGFKPIISSDCHQREMLDCGFEQAAQLLMEAGFTERYILTDKGFAAAPLKEA